MYGKLEYGIIAIALIAVVFTLYYGITTNSKFRIACEAKGGTVVAGSSGQICVQSKVIHINMD